MWKDCISIEGLGKGDVERLCCHKWFRVCTSINLHCHRRSIGRWYIEESNHLHSRRLQIAYTAATVNPTKGITYSEARSLMAAKSSPGGFVVATVTNPGSFMATITHPTGNGYCRDRILRDRSSTFTLFRLRIFLVFSYPFTPLLWAVVHVYVHNIVY